MLGITNTSQINASGKKLIQDLLSKKGMSSRAIREAGAHLVIHPKSISQVTIRMTANLKPKPSGGTGPLALDWWSPEATLADIIACVDLFSKRVWLFRKEEFFNCAQQYSSAMQFKD